MNDGFGGFSPDAWTFLTELEADNSKSFFDRHRARYAEQVAAPSKALVVRLAGILPEQFGLDVRAEAKVGRSLFRINRDTRFAADKTPYKTWLDFLFWVGDGAPRERPAFIMRLRSDSVLVGGGQAGLRGAGLRTYREALDDPSRGAMVRDLVGRALADGAELSEPDRARVPRPFPSAHPSAELLRRDGFHLSRTHPHPDQIATPAFAVWCADALSPLVPVVDWLSQVPAHRG